LCGRPELISVATDAWQRYVTSNLCERKGIPHMEKRCVIAVSTSCIARLARRTGRQLRLQLKTKPLRLSGRTAPAKPRAFISLPGFHRPDIPGSVSA